MNIQHTLSCTALLCTALGTPSAAQAKWTQLNPTTAPRARGISSAPAQLVFGFAGRSIDLNILGTPGCTLHTAVQLDLLVNLDGSGSLDVPAAIPASPNVTGLEAWFQAGCIDPAANAPA